MCGFIGSYNTKISKTILKIATKSINHRGPDDTKISVGKNWSIGFNRLAIIDLNKRSMQPFKNDDVIVFLNGEIFNYLELIEKEKEFKPKTKSDVEIVPFLYKKYGIKFLNKLNGMFSIVIIDEKKNCTYLIRDRYGEKPLFYIKKNKKIFFSSEISALKKIVNLEINKKNLEINFRCGFLPQPLTLYKNLFSVKPGCFLEVGKDKIIEHQWYNLKLNKDLLDNYNFMDAKNIFLKNFDNSLKLRLRSDVKVGLFISGGLDSNFLLKRMKNFKNKITLLYCNIPGKFQKEKNTTDIDISFDKSRYDFIKSDFNYNFFNKNLVRIVNNFDSILFDSSILIFYFLSDTAKKKKIKVILTGNGGDELFGGYTWQYQIRKIPNLFLKQIFDKRIRFLEKIYNTIYSLKFLVKLKNILNVVNCPLSWHLKSWDNKYGKFFPPEDNSIKLKMFKLNKSFYNKLINTKNFEFFNKFNFLTMKIFGVEQHHKIDLSSMYNSIENRSPFYDYKVIKTMMSISDKRKRELGEKGLLKKFAEGILPKKILDKEKSGPALNIGYLYKQIGIKDLLSFLKKNKKYFKKLLPEFFNEKLNYFISNFDKKKDMDLLFGLINFVIWCKLNIDNSIKKPNLNLEEILKT